MNADYVIPIGPECAFCQIHEVTGFAVIRKTPKNGAPVTYLIAKRPAKSLIDERPASVLEEFSDEARAIAALNRWATDPQPPKPMPKLRKPGAHRRNSNRPRRPAKVEAGQLELELRPDISN
jgi:hypothetical protein